MAEQNNGKSIAQKAAAGCGCLGLAIVALVVIGSNVDPAKKTAAADAETPAIAETQVTAAQLAHAYSANEVKAQSTYGDRRLAVTGRISAIALDMMDNPTLSFEGGNQFLPTQATFSKSDSGAIGNLSKGQVVTIHCTELTEVISAPMLSDCTL